MSTQKPQPKESKESKEPKEPKKSSPSQLGSDLLVGGAIGAFSKTLLAPIERVKLLIQTQDSNAEVLHGKVKRFAGPVDCVTRVYHEQGLNAFWRGNLANCIRYAPQQGSALAFNDYLNSLFPRYDPNTNFWKSLSVRMLSGGLAGAISLTICYPLDFARTRLASDLGKGKPRFNGITDCIMTTLRSQGLTGLYTGWVVTCAGAFVYRAGQLGLFKQIQDFNPWKDEKGLKGAFSAFGSVTLGRTLIMPFNYPFDTIRRRLMLQSEKPFAEREYKGGIDCFQKVLKKEGVVGLYRGMIPELFRGVGGSLVIVLYDRIKLIFGI